MIEISRHPQNPVLVANPENSWEAAAVFNGSVLKENKEYHMLYRAISAPQKHWGQQLSLSTIGYAKSANGVTFGQRRQFIKPEFDWEKYGCEDPRVTKIDDEYFIFYTAISEYPPGPGSIKIGLAISPDLETIREKHLVTPFNAKAMALFPKKIEGRYFAVLTANTDIPPAKIAIASFERKEELWSGQYWQEWYRNIDQHQIPLQRLNSEQVEAGAVPLETDSGWLLIYAHIQNYYQEPKRVFGIEAVLLDHDNPKIITGRTKKPILTPKMDYEVKGTIANVIFPSGAVAEKDWLKIYYGAGDDKCALAECNLNELIKEMTDYKFRVAFKLEKYRQNPIIRPDPERSWEEKAVFNPTAVYEQGKIYLIYRAMSEDNISTLGCAISEDGFNFDQRLEEPIYVPRLKFEQKRKKGIFSGCEDPRITKIKKRFYLFYTAYDGINPPRVALSSISVEDFVNQRWLWSAPVLISPPGIDDKNTCLFPEKINGKYVIFHRVGGKEIAIDYVDSLKFNGDYFLEKKAAISPREGCWDNFKIGVAGPPIKTKSGWLLFYHGVSSVDQEYRVGFMVLALKDPTKVIYRTEYPVLEATESFERQGGMFDNVVFPCGTILVNNKVFVYYGGADEVVCVASADLDQLLSHAK
ncbi:MAG: hypothetical protein ABH867_00970 [Patescibacteria group bacterium]